MAHGTPHRFPELLQQLRIAAGQGIGPFRVNDFVIGAFYTVPAQVARIFSRGVELGAGRQGGRQQEG